LKVGSKVTIKYQMKATAIEVKDAARKKKKRKRKRIPRKNSLKKNR